MRAPKFGGRSAKPLRRLLARHPDWAISRAGSGHWRLVSPSGKRLAAIQTGSWLIIGEGLESTLSAMQLTALPGWAALSATGIEELVLPPEATKVMIAADNDENGRGAEAAHKAAQRWTKQGRRVRISLPPAVGQDFNDLLLDGEGTRHTAE
jgi:phage/plasmid primase-like uncharacterized protein